MKEDWRGGESQKSVGVCVWLSDSTVLQLSARASWSCGGHLRNHSARRSEVSAGIGDKENEVMCWNRELDCVGTMNVEINSASGGVERMDEWMVGGRRGWVVLTTLPYR